MQQAVLIFKPFNKELWMLIVIVILVIPIFMFMLEHPYDNIEKVPTHMTQRKHEEIMQRFSVRMNKATGFMRWSSFVESFPEWIKESVLTMTAHSGLSPKTSTGRLLSVMYCLFCLLLVSVYVAELTVVPWVSNRKRWGRGQRGPHGRVLITMAGAVLAQIISTQ